MSLSPDEINAHGELCSAEERMALLRKRALKIACPQCGALPRHVCRTPNGIAIPPHKIRIRFVSYKRI